MTDRFVCSKHFNDITIRFSDQTAKHCCKSPNAPISVDELTLDFVTQHQPHLEAQREMIYDNKLPMSTCAVCINNSPSYAESTGAFYDIPEDQLLALYAVDSKRHYELIITNACDLKCVYCSEADSTSWAREKGLVVEKPNKEWTEQATASLLHHFKTKEWDSDLLYRFTISGGEPTYSNKTIKFIELVCDNIPKDINHFILINTNGNTSPVLLDRMISFIKRNPVRNFVIAFSLDDIGKHCEAIRTGLVWQNVISNMKQYMTCDNAKVVIAPTVNLLSVPRMYETVKFWDDFFKQHSKHPLHFTKNVVYDDNLTLSAMHPSQRNMLDDAIEYCHEHNIEYGIYLKHIKELIGTRYNECNTKVKEHIDYLEQMRPEYNWRELFPHIKDIIQ